MQNGRYQSGNVDHQARQPASPLVGTQSEFQRRWHGCRRCCCSTECRGHGCRLDHAERASISPAQCSDGRATGFTVVGTGDFNGDGTADAALRDRSGAVVDWIMKNGQYQSWPCSDDRGSRFQRCWHWRLLMATGPPNVLLQNGTHGRGLDTSKRHDTRAATQPTTGATGFNVSHAS